MRTVEQRKVGSKVSSPPPARKEFLLCTAILLVVLSVLFYKSFVPGWTLFSNDRSLGLISSDAESVPENFRGAWCDLNWVGGQLPSAMPDFNFTAETLLSPVMFLKFFPPFTLLLLGLSAWLCFRKWGLASAACVLAALAAALNSNILSNVCWGQPSRALALSMTFLALAALHVRGSRIRWMAFPLAGFAVGMGVMDAVDVGVIFSLYVAGYAVFQAFTEAGSWGRRTLVAGLRVSVIAICALWIAAQGIVQIVGTRIAGTVGAQQDAATKEHNWDFATMWSLPKREILRVIVPGLYGYRMETPGANYWGAVGQTPGVPTSRSSGAGEYAGVFVVLVAVWALARSFRRNESSFTPDQRRMIWFWAIMGGISLLLAFGRHAPFYQIVYALPFFSTIRNPIKFMHPFHLTVLILFAYGLHDLIRSYLQAPAHRAPASPPAQTWWAKGSFERKWMTGCFVVLGAAALVWLIYATSHRDLVRHLETIGIQAGMADSIASSSQREVAWSVFFFAVSTVLLGFLLSRAAAARHVKPVLIGIGALLLIDLGRANLPWIVYLEYPRKYASNPVIDLMRDKPYERRVTALPVDVNPAFQMFRQLYGIEWLQHHFQYYNVQSIDVIQDPRRAAENVAYREAMAGGIPGLLRLWELTNTRWILAPGGEIVEVLNQQWDPKNRPFKAHAPFAITAKPDVAQPTSLEDLSASLDPGGTLAILEFTRALPRAKLFSNWQIITNDDAALELLANPAFNPSDSVIVSDEIEAAPAGEVTEAGSVEHTAYAPKRVELSANVAASSVLLLNDKFHPDWKVTVNGATAPLLRCNYLMRGVFLPPGQHTVVFSFEPSMAGLFISLTAILAAAGLCGMLLVRGRDQTA
jgi:hypothetical protein